MTHPLLDAKFDQLDHNPVVDECLESQKAKQVTENNSENTPPTEEWPTLQQGNCTKRGKVCRVNRKNMKPLDMVELLQKYEREKELKEYNKQLEIALNLEEPFRERLNKTFENMVTIMEEYERNYDTYPKKFGKIKTDMIQKFDDEFMPIDIEFSSLKKKIPYTTFWNMYSRNNNLHDLPCFCSLIWMEMLRKLSPWKLRKYTMIAASWILDFPFSVQQSLREMQTERNGLSCYSNKKTKIQNSFDGIYFHLYNVCERVPTLRFIREIDNFSEPNDNDSDSEELMHILTQKFVHLEDAKDFLFYFEASMYFVRLNEPCILRSAVKKHITSLKEKE